MSSSLENKNIIITGASRGIGAGIAKYLAQQGACLGISYANSKAAAEELLKNLDGEGHFLAQLDISNEESVDAYFKEANKHFNNKIDGLVNNAGITKDQILLRMKAAEFDDVIATNLRGSFLCSQKVLKPMMKARGGSIVHITSVIGQMGNAGQANYAASKAGTEAFSKSLAKEMASRGVRSNCIAPGYIQTEMTEVLDDNQKENILSSVPMNRMGSTEDIAKAVHFLLSDDSEYITGQSIAVNGGLYM
ncbi:MAG: 3-oxoacyl-[acyl-carrier-protein] reductase [Bdellovibrionaceae bacterium]|nr:3-oxoacyl-[acyl-carrier-protein] reductase [Pseudobdellovibrionaceae bacterium]|tara:strand:- start:10297 stop:11043 length:747 start_codon:yes stop_codon:yes gene_type:complete